MKNKCRRLLRLLIVIIFCIGSIVGLSACSGNKGNEDIDPPNQEIPSDPSLDTIFDSDGTGADTNGLTYQKFISRSKKYKIAYITGYSGSDYADVVIPETVDADYTVTKIEEKAFENSNISSVLHLYRILLRSLKRFMAVTSLSLLTLTLFSLMTLTLLLLFLNLFVF